MSLALLETPKTGFVVSRPVYICITDTSYLAILNIVFLVPTNLNFGTKLDLKFEYHHHHQFNIIKEATTRDFQQCGILTSIDSDEPV